MAHAGSHAQSLSQFILSQQRAHPEATGEFTHLLSDIALAHAMIEKGARLGIGQKLRFA